jgi:nitrite reductase/ring-hydroxylating ferredoxin subunit
MADEGVSRPADGRRRTVVAAAVGLGMAVGLALVAPVLGVLVHPLRRRTVSGGLGEWLAIGRAEEFPDDRPLRRDLRATRRDGWSRLPRQRLGSVWVRRRADGALLALNADCPHLGCGVTWAAERGCFECPCHDSAFTADGAVTAGPSPRSLDALEVREHDGMVQVRFQRFRTGTAERVAV